MKKFFMFLIMLFVALGLIAANSINPEELPAKGADWLTIVQWVCVIGIPFIFDVIARYIPTFKNYSWVALVLKGISYVPKIILAIYEIFVPKNKSKTGGVHK